MDYQEYIVPTVVIATWILIQMIKDPVFKKYNLSRFIPLFAGVLGVILNVWLSGWKLDFMTFFYGLVSGFAATGVNEGINGVFFQTKQVTTE